MRSARALCLCLLWLHAPQTQAQDWSPEMGAALAAYERGDYAAAERLSRDALVGQREPRLRDDAILLQTLIQLRGGTREDRQDGMNRLAQLIVAEPALAERADVLLALARAHLGQLDSAAALRCLDTVLRSARKATQAVEALIALGDTWAQHSDWAATPPAFGAIFRPADASAALRMRVEQVEKLRDRARGTPEWESAVAPLELRIARLRADATDVTMRMQGLSALQALAEVRPLTPVAAQAALFLADLRGAENNAGAAVQLLERVAAEAAPAFAVQARAALKRIRTPLLEIEIASQIDAGGGLNPTLVARNVRQAAIEARRIDLAGWLGEHRGSLAGTALSTAGAALASQALSLDAPEHQLARVPVALAADTPPGAYVLTAVAQLPDGAELRAQRLVVVSNLRAHMLFGRESAVVALDPSTAEGDEPITLRFWMQGSFVPLERTLTGGATSFALPPEAQRLREKRWTCLLQQRDHVSLLQGELAQVPPRSGRCGLLTAPAAPRAGDLITVTGIVLDDPPPHDDGLQVEVRDAFDHVLYSLPVEPDAAGYFKTEFIPGPSLDGDSLGLSLRRGARLYENLRGGMTLTLTRADASLAEIELRAPTRLLPDQPAPTLLIESLYPWGTPAARVTGSVRMKSCQLFLAGDEDPIAEPRLPRSSMISLDGRGRARLVAPAGELLPEAPSALLNITATFPGLEQSNRASSIEILYGPRDGGVESFCVPPAPRAGEEAEIRVLRREPFRRTARPPTVTVRDADGVAVMLPVRRFDDGFSAGPWRPSGPGDFRVEASQDRRDGPPAVSRFVVRVQPGPVTGLTLRAAQWRKEANRVAARLALGGSAPTPLTLVALDDEPLGVLRLGPGMLPATAELPLLRAPRGRAQVRILDPARGPGSCLAATDLRETETHELLAALELDGDRAAPGATVRLRLRVTGAAAGAAALLRLTPEPGMDFVPWEGGIIRPPPAPWGGTAAIARSGAEPGTPTGAAGDGVPYVAAPGATDDGLDLLSVFGGATMHSDVVALQVEESGTATHVIDLPMPREPGEYRVAALVRDSRGRQSLATLLLDTRDWLDIALHVPEHLTVGDRSLAALVLRGSAGEAARDAVTFDADTGISLGAPRLLAGVGAGTPSSAPSGERRAPLELSIGDRAARVLLPIEAVAPGRSEIRARVQTARGVQSVHAVIDAVSPSPVTAASVTSASGIRVERSLLRLRIEHEDSGIITPDGDDRPVMRQVWHAEELEAGAIVSPGELLLVREIWHIERETGTVECVQTLPATCFTRREMPPNLRRLGRISRQGLNEYTWSAATLPAGDSLHEYVVAVVRPGSCEFPPPEVRVAGAAVRVPVGPRDLRVSAQGD